MGRAKNTERKRTLPAAGLSYMGAGKRSNRKVVEGKSRRKRVLARGSQASCEPISLPSRLATTAAGELTADEVQMQVQGVA